MAARIRFVSWTVALGLIALAVPALANDQGQLPPANDDFGSAYAIGELPFAYTVDTTAASVETGEPQPSCRSARRTAWFRVSPQEDENLVVETSGTFRGTLAVFNGTSFTDLVEDACAGGRTAAKVAFRALAGKTYFIQVGSARDKGGLVDLKLASDAWQQGEIAHFEREVVKEGTDLPVVSFHGRPRLGDPSIYDLTIRAGDQVVNRGVLTFGLVQEEIKGELLRLPRHSGSVMVDIAYRYDSSQYECMSDGGEGTPCTAEAPIKDLEWLTSGDGQRAELVINVRAQKDDTASAERTITIPFAGQAGGMTP